MIFSAKLQRSVQTAIHTIWYLCFFKKITCDSLAGKPVEKMEIDA